MPKLPLCRSLVLDLMAWKQDRFQHPWDHLQTFHRELGTLQLRARKLSSILSECQTFLRWLGESQLWTSGIPLLPGTSPSGPGCLVGAIDGVSIPERCLSLR